MPWSGLLCLAGRFEAGKRGYDHNFLIYIYITHDFSYGMSDRQSTFIWLDIYKKGRQRDRIIGFLALVLVTHGEATPFKLGPQNILNFFLKQG